MQRRGIRPVTPFPGQSLACVWKIHIQVLYISFQCLQKRTCEEGWCQMKMDSVKRFFGWKGNESDDVESHLSKGNCQCESMSAGNQKVVLVLQY